MAGAHDLHIWTVPSGLVAMRCHIEVTGNRAWDKVLDNVTILFHARFGIAHVTVQPETVDVTSNGDAVCSLDTESGRNACRLALTTAQVRDRADHAHRH